MGSRKAKEPKFRSLSAAIDIDAEVGDVYSAWIRYEDFPRFMHSVRRTKRIDEQRVLWDVDVAGHQIVWEARIIEATPQKCIRWASSWGQAVSGRVEFEPLDGERTRLRVEIQYRPNGLLQRIGAALRLPRSAVRRDLMQFRNYVETVAAHEQARD